MRGDRAGHAPSRIKVYYPTAGELLTQQRKLLALLRFAGASGLAGEMVESNRRWYDTAVDLGGTRYPVGALPFTETPGYGFGAEDCATDSRGIVSSSSRV